MNTAASVSTPSSELPSPRPLLLWVAWAVILLTVIPEIILRAFLSVDTSWMLAARIGVIGLTLGLTYAWEVIRALRGFLLFFLLIYLVEGWLMLGFVGQSEFWAGLFGPSQLSHLMGERLLRLAAVGIIYVFLRMRGLRRADFYLVKGDLRAPFEPWRWAGMKQTEHWTRFGRNFAIISGLLIIVFMWGGLGQPLTVFSPGLIGLALLAAAMNAFAEEFLYRMALLPQLTPLFGKHTSILLTTAWFALGHWFFVPSGLTGVLLAGMAGWVYAKSMLETGGFVWAWRLHWLADSIIYLLFVMTGTWT